MKKKRMKKAIVSTIAVLLLVSSMDCMSVQAGSISESGSTQANVDVAEEQTETEIADCTADRTTDAEGFVWDGNIIVDYKGTATDIVIPARAAAIGYSAISGKGITSVRFEANSQIKEIGTTGFADNSLLSTVELPKGEYDVANFPLIEMHSTVQVYDAQYNGYFVARTDGTIDENSNILLKK